MRGVVIMTLEEAIRKRIRELAKERNITVNMVSTLAGLTHTTLLSFMNNETHNPRISTLLHVCEAFDIELKDNTHIKCILRLNK